VAGFKRVEPVGVGLRGLGVGHPHMNVLGDHHAADHRFQRWNPDEAAIRLFALQADHLQFLPFEHQAVTLEHVRHDSFRWNIGAHFRTPESQFAGNGLVDVIDGRLRGQHLGIREGLGQRVEAEVVIRVAMADVDRSQLLATGADFFHHLLRLGFTELCVDKNGFFLAADQHRGHRKNRLGARVVDVEGQAGRRCVRRETESCRGEYNAFECGEADHLLLRCANAVAGDGQSLVA